MRQFAILALLISGIALSGCMTSPYGNFLPNTTASIDEKIADDVVQKIVALYPPASTRFDMQHVATDFFGKSLIAAMREKGYAILEFQPKSRAGFPLIAAETQSENSGLSLSYILDKQKDSDLVRITLVINHQQSMGRLYQLQDGTIYPAGYWVRKE